MTEEYKLGTSIEVLREAIKALWTESAARSYYIGRIQREELDTPSQRRQVLRKLIYQRKHRITALRSVMIPPGHLKLNSVFYEHLRRALERLWHVLPAGPHKTGTNLDGMPDLPDHELGLAPAMPELCKIKVEASALEPYLKAVLGPQPNPGWLFEPVGQREGRILRTFTDDMRDAHAEALRYVFGLPDFALETPKETTMKDLANIEITTRTYVNGVDISTMSKADIYTLIAGQEKYIDGLKTIQNKPKALQREIESRQQGIQALVDYLDGQDPGPAVPAVPAVAGNAPAASRDMPDMPDPLPTVRES